MFYVDTQIIWLTGIMNSLLTRISRLNQYFDQYFDVIVINLQCVCIPIDIIPADAPANWIAIPSAEIVLPVSEANEFTLPANWKKPQKTTNEPNKQTNKQKKKNKKTPKTLCSDLMPSNTMTVKFHF